MADLEEQLRRWLAAGVIDRPVADRIRAFERGRETPGESDRPALVEVLVYLGLAIAGAGIIALVVQQWSELTAAARITAVVVPSLVALAGGFGLRALRGDALRRGGSAAWFTATALVAVAAGVVAHESGGREEDVLLAAALVILPVALALWAVAPERLQVLGIAGAFVILAEALGARPDEFEPGIAGGVLIALSVLALAACETGLLSPRDTARPAFALLAAAGALHPVIPDAPAWALALSFALALALSGAGVVLRAFLYLAVGVALFFITLVILVFAHLEDEIGAPLALMLSGAAIVAAVVVVVQARGLLHQRRQAA